MPTHHRAAALERTLPSYLGQQGVRELIVIADGQPDNTEDVVRRVAASWSHIRLVFVQNGQRLGAPATKNRGIRLASEPLVLIGEDDVLLEPDYTSRLSSFLLSKGRCLVGGRLINRAWEEPVDSATSRANNSKPGAVIDRERLEGNFSRSTPLPEEVMFLHAVVLAPRELFESVTFDEAFLGNAYREETDFAITAGKLGFPSWYVPDAIGWHLSGGPSRRGGQRIHPLVYEYWTIRNTAYLLAKHKDISGSLLSVEGPVSMRTAVFTIRRLKWLVKRKWNRWIKKSG